MRLVHFIFAALLLVSCSTETTKPTSIELFGDFVLIKESMNDKSFEHQQSSVKSIMSFQENGYFIYYDDLANSDLIDAVDHIQEHYKGQFEINTDTLILSYMENQSETTELYIVQEQSDKTIVLKNIANNKAYHYQKR